MSSLLLFALSSFFVFAFSLLIFAAPGRRCSLATSYRVFCLSLAFARRQFLFNLELFASFVQIKIYFSCFSLMLISAFMC